MTSTPESWNDIGSMRIEIGMNSTQVQKLKDEIALLHEQQIEGQLEVQKLRGAITFFHGQQSKERCQMKVFFIILACVLAQHTIVTHFQASPNQSKEETRKPQSARHMADKNRPEPVQMQEPESQRAQHPELSTDTGTEASVERFAEDDAEHPKEAGEDAQDVKVNDSQAGDHGDQRGEEPKSTPLLEIQSVQHSDASTIESVAQAPVSVSANLFNSNGAFDRSKHQGGALKDPKDARGGRNINGNSRESHAVSEQTRDEPGDKKYPSSHGLGVALPEDLVEREGQNASTSTQESTLTLTDKFSHGTFWVCFPPDTSPQKIQTYAKVYRDVARRQKRTIYPFCYINSKHVTLYQDNHCDDVSKIIFVLEVDLRKSDIVLNRIRSAIPMQFSFEDFAKATLSNYEWFMKTPMLTRLENSWGVVRETRLESPVWFRQRFRRDQVIDASVVEEFLNDAFAGNLQAIYRPDTGDLRL